MKWGHTAVYFGAFLTAVVIATMFIGSLILTAADGQGAIVFLFSLPAMIFLFIGGRWVLNRFTPTYSSLTRAFVFLLKGEMLFLVVFLLGLFIPPTSPLSGLVMNGVVVEFTRVTGFSPYVWFRQKQDLMVRINQNLSNAKGPITVDHLTIGVPWDRVCFFGPYTTDAEAAPALGFLSATLERSQVRMSDQVTALVFLNDSGTLEVIDIQRDIIDLSVLSKTCLTRSNFPLETILDNGGRRVPVKPNH